MKYFAIAFTLVLFSCAPEVSRKKFDSGVPNLGGNLNGNIVSDANKNFNPEEFQKLTQWNGEYRSSNVFDSITNLHQIGEKFQLPAAKSAAEGLFNSFYSNEHTHTKTSIIRSPYFKAAAGVAEEPVVKQLSETQELLLGQEALIQEIVLQIDGDAIRSQETLVAQYDKALEELGLFIKNVEADDSILTEAKEPVAAEARSLIEKQLKPGRAPLAELFDESAPLTTTADALVQFAGIMEVEISEDDQKLLKKVKKMSPTIEAIKDPQTVLNALIELWFFFDRPSERRQEFAKAGLQELAEFFESEDADFNCLSKDTTLLDISCGFSNLAKDTEIFPQIRRKGVRTSKRELKDSFRARMTTPVREEVEKQILDLPQTVSSQISASFEAELQEIEVAKGDISNFADRHVTDFEKEHFNDQSTFLYEVSEVRVQGPITAPEVLAIKPINKMNFSAKTHGSQLRSLFHRWESQQEELQLGGDSVAHRQEMFGALNKILSFGGFRTQGDRLIKGLYRPVTGQGTPLSLFDLGTTETLYGVPSEMSMSVDFSQFEAHQNVIKVGDQAAILNGLSGMISTFKDWKVTPDSFDDTIGFFRARNLIKDINGAAGIMKLFPRSMVFSMVVGQSAAMLKGLTNPQMSPIAMIHQGDGSYNWLGDERTDGKQASIAGLVDWTNGARGTEVRTKDVAEYIVALGAFYQATDGIDQTNASVLTEKNIETGQVDEAGNPVMISAMDVLNDNRAQLKELVVGLINFLNFAHAGSGLAASYDLETKKMSAVSTDISTYFKVMQAYHVAKTLFDDPNRSFDEKFYQAPIVNLFNHINANHWDGTFYVTEGRAADPNQVLEGVVTLKTIKEHLPEAVQSDLGELLAKWTDVLF